MEKIDILGVKVSLVNNQNIISVITNSLKERKQIQVCTPNPEHIILAQENKEFKKILNNCEIAIPDGIGVVRVLQSRIVTSNKKQATKDFEEQNSKKMVERVTGVDLMGKLCVMAKNKKYRVGLLGASEEIRDETMKVLKRKYGSLEVFALESHKDIKNSQNEDKEIIEEINEKKINLLFVAYGAPYQEMWIAENLSKLKTVKLAIGVGGAFDFISGGIKRAPVFMQKIGLEWFYRLLREPWRIKRQMKLVKFLWLTR